MQILQGAACLNQAGFCLVLRLCQERSGDGNFSNQVSSLVVRLGARQGCSSQSCFSRLEFLFHARYLALANDQ